MAIQLQQTIIRGSVHILSYNIVKSVSLKVFWELCMVCQTWASLDYMSNWLAGITSLFRTDGIDNEVSNSELGESILSYQKSNIEIWRKYKPVEIWEGCCKKSIAPWTGPLTWSADIRIDEDQYQLYRKQTEWYLTSNSHFSTHWHQANIHNRRDWWRGRLMGSQEIYISVTNNEYIEVWG